MDRRLLNVYNSAEGAKNYQGEYTEKLHRKISDRMERRVFRRIFSKLGKVGTLVDLPCGAGRLYSLFQENAEKVVESDWSFHMLQLSRATHSGAALGHIRCNGIQLPYQDRAFDCLASIRLNHHFPLVEERLQHIDELLRVADKAVIVTWFSHHCLRAWARRVRARMGSRKRAKLTLRTSEVRNLAEKRGFRLAAAIPLAPLTLGSGHIFGLMIRERD